MVLNLIHNLPGRVRFRCNSWVDPISVQSLTGVREANFNPLTGSLLVHFDQKILSVETLAAALVGSRKKRKRQIHAYRSSPQAPHAALNDLAAILVGLWAPPPRLIALLRLTVWAFSRLGRNPRGEIVIVPCMTEYKKDDKVEWNSSQGKVEGTVEKKLTKAAKIKTHKVAASPDNPEYLVKSDKTGAEAAHKPSGLKKRK